MTEEKWKRWGTELRHHRTAAGLAQEKLARDMHLASSTVSTFEGGTRRPSREHAAAADEALATGGVLAQLWDELHDEREIPDDWRNYAKVERTATDIREYQPTLFPGLLQTMEYARAVLRNTGLWSDEQVENLANARTSRLEAVGEARLTFVLDEVIIRRVLGSRDILRGQLDAVLALLHHRRAKLLVIPDFAPLHPGPFGSFRFLTLNDGRQVVQEDYRTGVNVITGPQVNHFVNLFGNLQSEALNLHASTEVIEKVREEL